MAAATSPRAPAGAYSPCFLLCVCVLACMYKNKGMYSLIHSVYMYLYIYTYVYVKRCAWMNMIWLLFIPVMCTEEGTGSHCAEGERKKIQISPYLLAHCHDSEIDTKIPFIPFKWKVFCCLLWIIKKNKKPFIRSRRTIYYLQVFEVCFVVQPSVCETCRFLNSIF
jgi:hypothetical protein